MRASNSVRKRLLLFEPIQVGRAIPARGRLNHSCTRPEVRRRRNCLTVGGEEEEDGGDEGDGAGRAHPQRRSLPICSILLSKWAIVRYALPKRQVCPPRRAVKEEFLSRVADVCTSSSIRV